MIPYSIITIIATGTSYVLFLLFLKKEKMFTFNRFFLLGSLVLCLLSPALNLDPGDRFEELPTMEVETIVPNFLPAEIPEGKSFEIIVSEKTIFDQIFWIGYVVISGLFLFRFCWNLGQLINRVKNNNSCISKGLCCVLMESKENPYSFFHFLFINRKDFQNENFSRSVIQHELAHSKQLHSVDVVFMELLTCFLWFNPFVWCYKKAITENHEFLADAQVIRVGADMNTYCHQLIQTGNKNFSSTLISGFNFNQIKNRIMMMYKKRTSKTVMGVKVGMVLCLFTFIFVLTSFVEKSENDPFVVVVDAGHGGHDSGMYDEKTINLQVAKKLAALGEKDGVQIVLVRTKDKFISLTDRVKFINKQHADMLLSLHCNGANDSTRNGVVGFYARDEKSKKLSHIYSTILVSNYMYETGRQGKIAAVGFTVLQDIQIPGVMLELGFLSNEKEAQELRSDAHQQKIAENIYESLLEIKKIKESR